MILDHFVRDESDLLSIYHGPSDRPDDTRKMRVLGRIAFQHRSEFPVVRDGAPLVALHMVPTAADAFLETWSTPCAVSTGAEEGLVYACDGEYLFCAARIGPQGVYRDAVRETYRRAIELAHRLGYPEIFWMWNMVGGITALRA